VTEGSARILLVDDEQPIQTLLSYPLRKDGYDVVRAADGREALDRFAEQTFDLVVLDVMLPRVDGLEVCRRLRAEEVWSPTLMLTALDDVDERVRGLDAGADDYLPKPFSFEELLARIRALVRRSAPPRPTVLQVGDMRLDPAAHRAWRGTEELSLTSREFSLLETFMRHPGRVLSRLELLEHVWDQSYENRSNVIEVYVGYLRDKLDRAPEPSLIETVRGAGYRLRGDGAAG